MPELLDLLSAKPDGQNSLLQEMHHQINNNLQAVNSLINLQRSASKDNMEIASLGAALRRINAIAIAHAMHNGSSIQAGVNIKNYLKEVSVAIDNLKEGEHSRVNLLINVDDLIINPNCAIALGIITSELLTLMAYYAEKSSTKPDISLSLSFSKSEELIEFSIVNNMDYDGIYSIIEEEKFAIHLIDIFSRQIQGHYYFIKGNVFGFILTFKL